MLLLKKTFFVLIVFCILTACSKENTTPLELSLSKVSDSLIYKPVSFGAYVSETPESITWDFGDNSTGTGTSPQHTYQKLGTYRVVCTAKLRGKTYTASQQFEMFGDNRIEGQKRFYGTHTYSTAFGGFDPTNFVTVNITDTILNFTGISARGNSGTPSMKIFDYHTGLWQHDNGTEVLYHTNNLVQVYSSITTLAYYPANDSTYVYFIQYGYKPYPGHEYKLYQKK